MDPFEMAGLGLLLWGGSRVIGEISSIFSDLHYRKVEERREQEKKAESLAKAIEKKMKKGGK